MVLEKRPLNGCSSSSSVAIGCTYAMHTMHPKKQSPIFHSLPQKQLYQLLLWQVLLYALSQTNKITSKDTCHDVIHTVNMQLHTLSAKWDAKAHSRRHVHKNVHSLWHLTRIRNWYSRRWPHAKLWHTAHRWKPKWCLRNKHKESYPYLTYSHINT